MFRKMKLNGPGGQKLQKKRFLALFLAKHAWLYSDLFQALKAVFDSSMVLKEDPLISASAIRTQYSISILK